MGIAELGGVVILRAIGRTEYAAQNLANMTTAGYKARHPFQNLINANLAGVEMLSPGRQVDVSLVDFSFGKLQHTGNPFDIAISGSGFFAVRGTDGLFYTRSGQFSRDDNGRLITSSGAVLQSSNGDVQVDSGDFTVLTDGTIEQNGQPISQLTISTFDSPNELKPIGNGLFSAPAIAARDSSGVQVRQGMLEASNVDAASEMISMMTGLRSAEAGQRLVQVYDDLIGRAIAAFGQT